jgi:hypothetical protein
MRLLVEVAFRCQKGKEGQKPKKKKEEKKNFQNCTVCCPTADAQYE